MSGSFIGKLTLAVRAGGVATIVMPVNTGVGVVGLIGTDAQRYLKTL